MARKRKPTQPALIIRKTAAPVHFSGDQRPTFEKNGFKAEDRGAPR